MQWSKVRKLILERMCESMRGSVDFHSARYGNCSCGRAWMTIDGVEVANFCTRAYWNWVAWPKHGNPNTIKKYDTQLTDYGELSRQQVYESIWAFLHDLSLEEALLKENPIVQSLAVIDSKLGKRRLQAMDPYQLHPLARTLLVLRIQRESIANPFVDDDPDRVMAPEKYSYRMVVNAWIEAAKDLNLIMMAPFEISLNRRWASCVANLLHFGCPEGVLIEATFPPSFSGNPLVSEYATQQGLALRQIDAREFSHYRRARFVGKLSEWGFFGDKANSPEWLAERSALQ